MKKMAKLKLDILSPKFIDRIPLIVIGLDQSEKIIYWNKNASFVTGYGRKEAMRRGLPLFLKMLLTEENSSGKTAKEETLFNKLLSGKIELENQETSILTRSGNVRHISWNSYLIDDNNSKRAVIITGGDVTNRFILQESIKEKERYLKATAGRLRKYISLDPLTNLLNYRYFISHMKTIFDEHRDNKKPLSLVIMDIDYFRSINHIHGLSSGDRILRKISFLIKNNLKKDFLIARFGGAEFAVLMPRTDIKTALASSTRLFSVLTDHDFRREKEDTPINVMLHMAIGNIPHSEDVHSAEQFLERVSDKLREAKMTRNNSILICSPNEYKKDVNGGNIAENGDYGEYRYTVEFVNALANTVKMNDMYTREHSASMANYAVYIADYLNLSAEKMQIIKLGSILHDIGKIGIDKMILLKPGPLTKAEYNIIKQHPRTGAEIIRSVRPLKKIVPLVLYHHERYDGKGYLNGLRGEEIPLEARIVSLADVFQALTSDRPYRRALSEKEAIDIIKDYSGKHFDPQVAKAFLEIYKTA